MMNAKRVWLFIFLGISLCYASNVPFLFRSPFSNGALQYACTGNPAMLLSSSPPGIAMQVFFVPVSANLGNSQLAIPDPISLFGKGINAGNWFANMLIESFGLQGLDPGEVSDKITKEARNGMDIFTNIQIPLAGYNTNRNKKSGWGIYAASRLELFSHIPGEPFLIVFSPSEGLQPGNLHSFSDFTFLAQATTDISYAYGRKLKYRLPIRILENFDIGVAGKLTYTIGHSMFLAQLDEAVLDYTKNNVLSLMASGKFITTGTGLSGNYRFENPFATGVNKGNGAAASAVLSLTRGNLNISAGILDLGVMVWDKGIRQAKTTITGDSIYLVNISSNKHTIKTDWGNFESRPPKSFPYLTSLLFESSMRWDYPITAWSDILSQYRTVTTGYKQPVTSRVGSPMTPVLGLALENGFYYGKFPLRIGWTVGGVEKTTSFIEIDNVEQDMSYSLYYRAIGDGFFRFRKGVELGVRLHFFWDFPHNWKELKLTPKFQY